MKEYHVYIMASRTRCLYIGCTSALARRVVMHRTKFFKGHTARYRIDRLVYAESAPDARSAIARERALKGWTRARKVALIESVNPTWDDLAGPNPDAARDA